MDIDVIMQYFVSYGPIAIYVIVLLEYLNLPGFRQGGGDAGGRNLGVEGELNFFLTMVITVAAGLTGSIILYALGRGGGEVFMKKYYKRFPKQQALIESEIEYLREKGGVGIFFSKLIPMVRTLISIPAGMIKMNFAKYVVSSMLGVAVWNLVFVGAGYIFGDAVFTMFA